MTRGDVYHLRAPRDARGHEQRGHRYAVVVQTDHLVMSTLIVAPTSSSKAPGRFRPSIEIGDQRTTVLVEQLQAVDPDYRLGRFAGRVSRSELESIDRALLLLFGL